MGDARKLDLYARRLKGYVLEPYVAYWQLRMRLEEANPAELRRFFANYEDARVSGMLLADWLKLTGKNQQWDLFDADYPRYRGDDFEITCYGIQSKMRSGHPEALYEARPLWFVARDLPDNCNQLFGPGAGPAHHARRCLDARARGAGRRADRHGVARIAVSAGRPAARLPARSR